MNNNCLVKSQKRGIINYSVSFFILLVFSSFSFAQNDAELRHFQKKLHAEQLVLPHDNYDSKVYLIYIPDSVYTKGEIIIKKMKAQGFRAKATFFFEKGQYYRVEYNIKKKHLEFFMQCLENDNRYLALSNNWVLDKQGVGKRSKIIVSTS